MAFLIVTLLLLIFDLKRPERFLLLLTHPNPKSWLVRGGIILAVFGVLLAALIGAAIASATAGASVLLVATATLAALTAGYTASLFAQAKGRVLWMQRGLWPTLIVQAMIAGAAALLLLRPILGANLGVPAGPSILHGFLLFGLGYQLVWFAIGHKLGPRSQTADRADEYGRAWALFASGPHGLGLRLHLVGWICAMLALGLSASIAGEGWAAEALPRLDMFAAFLALLGLHRVEHDFVRAGQELPIS
jgi:formate-dependent nitrite reductase membrane component NrfD